MTKLRELVLQEPNERNINACWEKWKGDKKNIVQEKILHSLFKEKCPENTKIEGILLKVSVLNDFYRTRILDTYTVSKHILKHEIDKKLRSEDLDLVNEIAPVKIGKEIKTLYSFASKYCSHHEPEIYPIYDRYVDEMLWHFQKKDKFSGSPDFKRKCLKDYKRFSEIVNSFKGHYGLDKFSLREIDIYLWSVGRKYFSKKH